ncbi:MAG: hypothetical protein ABI488_00945 [Polyangiaceae bacterium]
MKRCAAFLWATVTFLGWSVPAWADDAPVGANLQAGGLKPPEAVLSGPNATAPSATEANLDRADKEDSGRGLEFVWLNAEAGPEYLGLQTLKAKGLVDNAFIHSKDLGMTYGAGLGVRLLVFTLGARFRFGNFPDWQTWALNAEGGMHIPLGRVEPYVNFGGGYSSLGAYNKDKLGGMPLSAAHGFNVRGGAGVDWYLTNTFSIGANLTGEILYLSRKASAPTPQQYFPVGSFANSSGYGVGAGATLSAVLGLHF